MRAFQCWSDPSLHLYIADFVSRYSAELQPDKTIVQNVDSGSLQVPRQQMHSSKWCSHGAKSIMTAKVCTMMAGRSGAALLGASF